MAITSRRDLFNTYDDNFLTISSNIMYTLFYQLVNKFRLKDMYEAIGIKNSPNHVIVFKLTELIYQDIDIYAYRIKTHALFIIKDYIVNNKIEATVSSQIGSSNIILLCYIDSNSQDANSSNNLDDLIKNLSILMKEHVKNQVAVGVSVLNNNSYYDAYREALIAVEQAYFVKENEFVFYDLKQDIDFGAVEQNIEIENYLNELIINSSFNNKETIYKRLYDLFKEAIDKKISRNKLKWYLLKIINYTEAYLLQLGLDKNLVNTMAFECYNDLENSFHLNHMNDIMKRFFFSAFSEVNVLDSLKYKNLKYIIDDYFEKNYMHNLTVEELAEVCNYSRFHFMRIFKDIYGITFSQYLTDFRIEKAIYMLCYTKESFKAIAEKTGYNNSNYFNTVFKNKIGINLKDYRQQYRQIEF